MRTLGIDVGGTKISAVLIEGGESLRSLRLETPKNKKDFLALLEEIIVELGPADGLGLALPGLVDYQRGKIIHLPNLKFMDGYDIAGFLQNFNQKIEIDNDAKCILLAEMIWGAARGCKNVVLIAAGTGIGGAIAIERKLYYGDGAAGEIGHMLIEGAKELEHFAGGKTIRRKSASEYKNIGKYLGFAAANLINILNPEILLLAGGIADNHARLIVPEIKKAVKKYVLAPHAKNTPIVLSELKEFAGAVGAALLAQK